MLQMPIFDRAGRVDLVLPIARMVDTLIAEQGDALVQSTLRDLAGRLTSLISGAEASR